MQASKPDATTPLKTLRECYATVQRNILADYPRQCKQKYIDKVLEFYDLVFSEENDLQRESLYRELYNDLIVSDDQTHIVQWIESKRSSKYENLPFPFAQPKTQNLSRPTICKSQQKLRQSRFVSIYNYESFTHHASQDEVFFNQGSYCIKEQEQVYIKHRVKRKVAVLECFRNGRTRRTAWIRQMTKDHRYVWRSDIKVDRIDVENLLKFLLTVRNNVEDDACPTIVINAGSHGNKRGRNSHDTGLIQLTDMRIYQDMLDIIENLLESKQEQKLKLTKENARTKIMVNLVTPNVSCIYPEMADHIIDVHCNGARYKIPAKKLHPNYLNKDHSHTIKEDDLLFRCDSLDQDEGMNTFDKSIMVCQEDLQPLNSKMKEKKSKEEDAYIYLISDDDQLK